MSPIGMPPPPDYSHHQQAEADHAQRIQDALLEAAKRKIGRASCRERV